MHILTSTRSDRWLAARDERGFTLPEMLVALILSLVMSGAAISAVVHTYRSSNGASSLTDVNQNLRVAINIVVRDILQTGMEIPVGGISIPSGAPELVLRPGPTGADLTFPATWATMPAVTPGPDLGPVIEGVATDMVTVLRSDVALPWDNVSVIVSANGQRITFPAAFAINDSVNGIKSGDLMMLTANGGSTLLEVTGVTGQDVDFGVAGPSHLNQHTAQGSVMPMMAGLVGVNRVANARRILMITYYLDGSGDSPTLMRRINYGAERKIAVGIENMQLTWDLVDGVDNPSGVDEPEVPNTPNQIRKANLEMAGRSFELSSSGTYLRSNLRTQIALRSLAFMDRYQ